VITSRAFIAGLVALAVASPALGQPRHDALGDPLPEGAIARLGTTRLQHVGASDIAAADFSPDSKTLASVDDTGKCILWDAITGKLVRELSHNAGINAMVAWADQGKSLVFVEWPGDICWCDVATGKVNRTWRPFAAEPKPGDAKEPLNMMCIGFGFSPRGDYLAVALLWFNARSAVRDQTVVILDVSQRKELWRLRQAFSWDCWAFSPDGKQVLAQKNSGARDVWDTATGKAVHQLVLDPDNKVQGRNAGRLFVASEDLLIADDDGIVSIWSYPAFKKKRTLKAREVTRPLAVSPDGKTLASALANRLYLLDIESGTEKPARPGHNDPVESLAFSVDGRELWTSSILNKDPRPASPGTTGLAVPRTTHRYVEELLSWQSGTWKKNSVSLWDLSDPKIVSADHRLFMDPRSSDDGVFALATNKVVTRFQLPKQTDVVGYRCFSPRGDFALVRLYDGQQKQLGLFETRSGKLLFMLGFDEAGRIAFSEDERWLAVRHLRAIEIVQISTGKRAATLTYPQQAEAPENAAYKSLEVLSLSPDGSLLAACVPGGSGIQVWSVAKGKKRFEIQTHGQSSSRLRVAWSPDGRMMAVGGLVDDHRIQIWETTAARMRLELPGHGAAVTSLAFSPDGRCLLSGSVDTTVLVWSVWN
jgi:WD40 repeat protein